MKIRVGQRPRRSRLIVAGWVLLGLALLAVLGFFGIQNLRSRSHQIVPKPIAAQLSFSPLIIDSSKGSLEAGSYKYDKANAVLSYVVRDVANGKRITITEQSQPAQFTEITGYQDQFLTNVIQQSETIQTSNGTVYLGHPSKQPTQQIAVIIDRGLLVFMTPQASSTLTTSEWRSLVEQLEIQKIL